MRYILPASRNFSGFPQAFKISAQGLAVMGILTREQQQRIAAERRAYIDQNGLPEAYATPLREVAGTSSNGFNILFNDAADEAPAAPQSTEFALPTPPRNKKSFFSFLLGEASHDPANEISADRPFSVKVLTTAQATERLWDRVLTDQNHAEIPILRKGLELAAANRRTYTGPTYTIRKPG